ncbi:MAG: hypothetical protein JJ843_00840 [Prochlorococcus marinus CUG1434]|nr:hypothetical protein [Prochlorococcus marinus CUG1434]
MNRKNNLLTPEKAAYYLPVFISSGIAILLIIFLVFPQYIKSNKVNLELNELIKKKNDLENLKSQYKLINQKFSKLNKKRSRIIELISGTSNLDTLIAQLGEIAKKNNIEFISIVPKNIISFIDDSSEENISKNNQENEVEIDPLLVEGTKKYLIESQFKTDFVHLLSFLRELEFQDNIILIDDINVKLDDQKSEPSQGSILKIKLMMTIYGQL